LKKVIIIAVPIIVVASIIGFVKFFPQKKEVGKTTSPAKVSKAPEPEATDATKNWKKYESTAYKFSFLYPPTYTIEEMADLAPSFLQVNLSKPNMTDVIVMARGDYEPKDVNTFVGADPETTKKINGRSWYFFSFPQGYSHSPPFTTFQTENNNLYSFKFHNTISNEIRDQIMATITFTP
jgi:hypothetical protein